MLNEIIIGDFAILALFVAVLWAIYNIFLHVSCFIARKTKKRVCMCWDCVKKCELYKKSEPEISEDLDGMQYFFCGYCNHNIAHVGTALNSLKRFHKYCGHCGNTLSWSFLDDPEDELDVKPFGTGKSMVTTYRFYKKENM